MGGGQRAGHEASLGPSAAAAVPETAAKETASDALLEDAGDGPR